MFKMDAKMAPPQQLGVGVLMTNEGCKKTTVRVDVVWGFEERDAKKRLVRANIQYLMHAETSSGRSCCGSSPAVDENANLALGGLIETLKDRKGSEVMAQVPPDPVFDRATFLANKDNPAFGPGESCGEEGPVAVSIAPEDNAGRAAGEPVETRFREAWEEFLGNGGRMDQDIQWRYFKESTIFRLLLCPFNAIWQLLLAATCCCCHLWTDCEMAQQRRWDDDLRRWTAEFNKKLSPLGVYAKTQSFGVEKEYSSEAHGGSAAHIEAYIVVAVTADEIMKLKSEPNVLGYREDHLDRHEIAMHPPEMDILCCCW